MALPLIIRFREWLAREPGRVAEERGLAPRLFAREEGRTAEQAPLYEKRLYAAIRYFLPLRRPYCYRYGKVAGRNSALREF
jgi:hypothetical protein